MILFSFVHMTSPRIQILRPRIQARFRKLGPLAIILFCHTMSTVRPISNHLNTIQILRPIIHTH